MNYKKHMRIVMGMLLLLIGILLGTQEAKAATIVESGTTGADGDNLTWTIDSDKVLTISGKGAMGSYASVSPWEDADIVKIVIEEGVTTIGREAFEWMQGVESVEIADTVTLIADHSFYECRGLTEIVIPESVQTIEDNAFLYCTNLETVIFKGDPASIGVYPFGDCSPELVLYSHTTGNVKENAVKYEVKFQLISEISAADLYISEDMGTSYATLTWNMLPIVSGCDIYKYNSESKAYEFIERTGRNETSYKVSGFKSGNIYRYKVCPIINIDGEEFRGEERVVKFRTQSSKSAIASKNDKISDGFVGVLKTTSQTFKNVEAYTDGGLNPRWASVSYISQFTDNKNNYCIAYKDGENKYLYIRAYNTALEQVYSRKIKMKYPLLGGVACDEDGYFYIVWGQNDTDTNPGDVTMAVSKYKKNGDHVKTLKFATEKTGATKEPFRAGNCDIAIKDGVLVCNYARQMYNGHQSNGKIEIDIEKMEELTTYYNYVSHSFDQRVLFDKDGVVWFVNHGDGYPRAFEVATSGGGKEETYESFHFYAEESALDDMYILNVTKARLGGVVETSSGLVLVGSSVKSLKESGYDSQVKNLFVMYADPDKKMLDGVSRSGICLGENVTNTGVKWLTNNTSVEIENPQVVYTDNDRIVILYETFKNYEYKNTYYMILSSTGKVLQKATKIRNARLNSDEEPVYKDGYIYWSSCNVNYAADKVPVKHHRLSIKSLTYDKDKLAVKNLKATKTASKVTLKWKENDVADGYLVYKHNGEKYVQVKKVTGTSAAIKNLKKNTNYKFAVKAYKKIDGTTYYGAMKYLKVKTTK